MRLPVGAGVALLLAAARDAKGGEAAAQGAAGPAVAFWAAAARLALHLVARQRILPGLSPAGVDAWRVGPLDPSDVTRIAELAAAMPAAARAVPVPGRRPLELPEAQSLLRGFLDAVADTMPRTVALARATGATVFADTAAHQVPDLRAWADEIRAGHDSGIRVSLRLETTDAHIEQAALRVVAQVHSRTDPSLVVDAGQLWAATGHGFGESDRVDTMLAVRRAARLWPVLGRLLDTAVPEPLVLGDEEVTELLDGVADRLAEAGIAVHWPRELVRELTFGVVVGGGDGPLSDVPGFFGGDRVLSFDWRLALRGQPLTEVELDVLAETHRPMVRLRNEWLLVDPELVRRARERHLKPLSAIDALGAALTGSVEVNGERVEVAASGWLETVRQRLADGGGGREVSAPAGLAAQLRDYQLQGLRWLAGLTSLGLGGCLADDMGLGKTITLIALHLHRQAETTPADGGPGGPTLVVCPASLLGNWEREIGRFAPDTPVRRYHGGGRSLDGISGDGVVLTTYATMRLDADRLAAARWGLVVADEAQHAKNPLSGTAKALRAIPAGARVALTGTPVENNLTELWSILDWTTPGLLGTLTGFRARWARPIEADRDAEVSARLSRLVRPFLLRRRKSDPGIAPELPAKTVTDRPVSLTVEQAGLYEAVVREIMAQIRDSDGMARRGLIVKLLTGLKQICNHPAQYLKEPQPRLAGRSGKLELLDELLDIILPADGAVLVFTQYVAMARLIERHLRDRGIGSQLLHGGTPVARREELVGRFQDGAVPVFLLSLKAAGTGLNLTRADHVVHYDRWWNPAVEQQATDRAYRIGQTRPVQVHRLIAEGTVEDRIAAMLAAKQDLADAVLGSGEAALTELTDAELAELVELRRAP
ncbi:DEAD/DEAH box helicase [Micromonospora sp. NPDC003197]